MALLFRTIYTKLTAFFGQGEDELGPHPLGADDIDIFSMCLDGLLDNGQTQAGALLVLSPGGVCLVEALPDLVQGCLYERDWHELL